MTDICVNPLWSSRLCCILSYNGGVFDSALNYTVLAVNVGYGSVLHARGGRRKAIASLTFSTVYQIGLCWMVHCSGVSIIWCACAGWFVRDMLLSSSSSLDSSSSNNDEAAIAFTKPESKKILFGSVMLVDFGTIAYYSIVEEPITTVAHGCALLMGWLLHWFSFRFGLENPNCGRYESIPSNTQ